MIGIFRGLARGVGFVLRIRALRPLLVLAALVWAFDTAVTLGTDAAWYSSVSLGPLWRAQLLWQTGIGALFVTVCLASSVGVMRVVARPVSAGTVEPSLPRALERWQPLRARSLRLGWLALVVTALLLGRNLANHWSEFALWSAHRPEDGITEFWTGTAPALSLLLSSLWMFALVAGLVALGAGALRALPFLAARPGVRPVRWMRTLGLWGALLLLLRALGFLFEAAWHAQVADENGFSRPLFVALCVAGALGCLALVAAIRRPRPQLALWMAAMLVLPALGGDLLAPFAGRGSSAPQTTSALSLPDQSPQILPIGDEATLLRIARLDLNRDKDGRLISWESAGLSTSRDGRGLRADIVGTPVVGDAWVGHGAADEHGDLVWQSLDLPEFTLSRDQPIGPLFYGPDARPLLSDEGGEAQPGVPLVSWSQKLMWAWRLRDPFLLFDGTRAKRLLIWRGAGEIGRKIAPFWTWDEAVPRRDPKTGAAFFECVAYSSTAQFPRRAPLRTGLFAGQNAVFPVAVLRLDTRSGAVQLAPFFGSAFVIMRWRDALPSLSNQSSARSAPTPALQTSLADGEPLVWTRGTTIQDWQKRAMPIELRARVRDKLAEFASDSRARTLEGATPVVWRQNKILWLAQSFFPPALNKEQTSTSASSGLSIQIAGLAVGPLEESGMGWGGTLDEARTAVTSRPDSPNLTQETATPIPTRANDTRSVHELARAALESQRAASKALRKGNYVETQRQNERTSALIEQMARQTH